MVSALVAACNTTGLLPAAPTVMPTATIIAVTPTAIVSGTPVETPIREPTETLAPSTPAQLPTTTSVIPTSASETVTMTGVMNTVYNHKPRYTLMDDAGRMAVLLLDPEVTRPFGGPLALDRKRMTITGKVTGENPLTIQVLSILLQ